MDQADFPLAFHLSVLLYHSVKMGESANYHNTAGELGKRSWIEKGLYQEQLDVAQCKAGCHFCRRSAVS